MEENLQKWRTREVKVGSVGVGGNNPVRIQSMTTSNTRDVEATVQQIIRLSDEGCDIVRVTVQGMKEADACEGIKNTLIQRGYTIPVVADIHFYPPAAMRVADFVDKVRINPGNFVDKRASFKVIEYDDISYGDELKRLEEKFTPLVEKCKKRGIALRIGTNHGSLSDRIMNRFGDTPEGMVESALEFAQVCRKLDFHDIIFSMKASNTVVMIRAYRLLVAQMLNLGWNYPLHLGVTEAGEGEDGRVKSAIGIGSLLLDGIGDTVRVSLTEDPWSEIDPCRRLVRFAKDYSPKNMYFLQSPRFQKGDSQKRETELPSALHRDGSVVLSVSKEEIESSTFFKDLGCKIQFGRPEKHVGSVDAVIVENKNHPKLEKLIESGIAVFDKPFIVDGPDPRILEERPEIIFFCPRRHPLTEAREFFDWLNSNKIKTPVLLQLSYHSEEKDLVIQASCEYGSLLCDGMGEGISLVAPDLSLAKRKELSFSILQGARLRQSKTEFISCPGCGRTLFDLQKVAQKIREKTSHLVGVKIAIMGCIVNGPGEMADADFGYVGSKPGKIDLYVGKVCVEKDIDMKDADEKLIELIKDHGRWTEPSLEQLSEV